LQSFETRLKALLRMRLGFFHGSFASMTSRFLPGAHPETVG
jgi:hypothetical protein